MWICTSYTCIIYEHVGLYKFQTLALKIYMKKFMNAVDKCDHVLVIRRSRGLEGI